MSAFFELYVIAMFVRQSIFNSETSIALIGSVNSNLRLFRLARVRRRDYLIYNSGIVVLGCFGIREVSRSNSAIFADLAMRGFAISIVTLARVASSASCLSLLCGMLTS